MCDTSELVDEVLKLHDDNPRYAIAKMLGVIQGLEARLGRTHGFYDQIKESRKPVRIILWRRSGDDVLYVSSAKGGKWNYTDSKENAHIFTSNRAKDVFFHDMSQSGAVHGFDRV